MLQHFRKLLILLTVCASYNTNAQEYQNIKIQKITNSLSYILFKENASDYVSSVMVFCGKDGVIMIDNGSKESYGEIQSYLKTQTNKAVKYIILTHWHFDHTNGDSLKKEEAVLISHKYTREMLSNDQTLLGMKFKAYPSNLLPQMVIDSKTTIYMNNDTIEVIPLPGGHTGGDLVVYFRKAGVLHVGDLVFADMFPFCDTDHGGNVFCAIKNMQFIIDNFPANTIIIPSHGKNYTMMQLKEYKDMFVKTSNIVKEEVNKGKTLETLKKENVLKDFSKWAISFTCEDWIGFIYQSIKK
jgi:cyclase